MKLLAIDCSTPLLSVALLNQNNIPFQQQIEHHPPEPNPVLSLVDRALKTSGCALEQLDGFALTVGPGSFTGLRVGLSLVKGFVLALEKPVVGIGSLEAWAHKADAGKLPVCSVLDARKGEVYYARFRSGAEELEALGAEQVGPPETLIRSITEPTAFIGTGLLRYGPAFQRKLGQNFLEAAPKPGLTPAGAAARLAARRFDTQRCFDLNQFSLRYLRKPEAEVHFNGG